ncbi:hypothetical protein Y032_0001g273 [Ancylostoma ceylanicum]|uniref:Uncharacterized protein n=1 Tax=Ancylostoma ceylanicum TaxID=53326 RepID=A0A016W4D7_9BILA|nr:hypothetical protein Y032_0001g273 [Ancylostoma ceylanicum]
MTDPEQNRRWAEHFHDISNQLDPLVTYSFDGEGQSFGELDVNISDISAEEAEAVVKELWNRKAPGFGEIPVELVKNGGRTMTGQLRWLFSDCQ